MMNKALRCIARGSVVFAAMTGLGGLTAALAGDEQARSPFHFSGLLNDYTPSAAVTKGGPYEMHGKWSLEVDEGRGTTRFEAAMNMETSDYGITQGTVNKDDPAATRGAHTHHINFVHIGRKQRQVLELHHGVRSKGQRPFRDPGDSRSCA